jgi:alpha-ketoglutarate-dependent taurine dioxygenase
MTKITDIFETEIKDDRDYIELALTYGTPIKSRADGSFIDTLIAVESNQVEKDSLSKRYGLDEFPIHTDCAYLKTPPKYILLRYVGSLENPTPTIVVNFDKSKLSDDEIDFIHNTIWFVKSKEIGFYSPIFKDGILRYDKEVMKMANPNKDKMIVILDRMERFEIKWSKNKVAVINNHSVLHFRPQIKKEENNRRILQRINIL